MIKWPDWIVAIFTIVIAVVGFYQWRAINGQLSEMQASGKQTDRLVFLYQQQLAQMRDQVTNTHDLAVAAEAQAVKTGIIAKTAKDANELARDSLQIAQRPYIVAGRKDGIVAEFRDSQTKDGKPAVALYFQNSGHLPTDLCIFVEGSAYPTGGKILYGVKRIRTSAKDPSGFEQINDSFCPSVGGDSSYIYTVPLPYTQEIVDSLRNNNHSDIRISAYTQYCDPFTGYVGKHIDLKYFVEYKAFGVLSESDITHLYRLVPDIRPTEYSGKLLAPCPTANEEEQYQKRFRKNAGYLD